MRQVTVSAPGKLFVGGEYAVLEGAPAVVTTVDRRAVATTIDRPVPASPVLTAVADAVARELGMEIRELPTVAVNTDRFSLGRAKLGLGVSVCSEQAKVEG